MMMHVLVIFAVAFNGCMRVKDKSRMRDVTPSDTLTRVAAVVPHEVVVSPVAIQGVARWVGTLDRVGDDLMITVIPNYLTEKILGGTEVIDPDLIGSGKQVILTGELLDRGIHVAKSESVPASGYSFPLFWCSSVAKIEGNLATSYFIEADEMDRPSHGQIRLFVFRHSTGVTGGDRFAPTYLAETFVAPFNEASQIATDDIATSIFCDPNAEDGANCGATGFNFSRVNHVWKFASSDPPLFLRMFPPGSSRARSDIFCAGTARQ